MISLLKDVLRYKKARSPKWKKLRAEVLKKHPYCAVCGSTLKLELHHIVPYHMDPSLELAEFNLIPLCQSKKKGIDCHRAFGHLGNYRLANPTVREDAAYWFAKLAGG